jgi:drug/metabolite transporter (DMT)-like permease
VRALLARSPRLTGVLMVGAGVVLLSPDALWVRLLSTDYWTLLFWRGACTSIGYLLLIRVTSGRFATGSRRTARARLAIGALSVAGNLCFVGAVTHTTAAQTLVILASSPLLAALLTAGLGLERIARTTWVSAAIVVPCIAVIVVRPGTASLSVGDLYAVVGAVSLAALLVAIRHSGTADVVPTLAFGGALTAVVAAPFANVLALSASDVLVLVLGFGISLPVSLSLIMRGPRYLAAPEVGLVLLLETVLGPLWVWLALGEQPTSRVALAGVVILATLALTSLASLRGARLPTTD